MTKKTKIILLIGITGVAGVAAYFLLRKKGGSVLGGTVSNPSGVSYEGGSWKKGHPSDPANDKGDEVNVYKLWGYTKDNASQGANPAPYPRIKVFTPDGKPYGGEYVGDKGGVYSLWIPSEDFIVEISAPGYQMYRNPAKVVSNGYKLFMRKEGE
jgi:hypothetical protein